jgi:hypothetical protein
MSVEMRDVAPGLWLWRQRHPDWQGQEGWEPEVSSFCVESRGEVLVLDALAPPEEEHAVWERLDARPPTVAVVLKPDHVRDVDVFVGRYGARAYGPVHYFKDDIPESDLVEVLPDDELPGGVLALDDGRRRHETPLYLPEQRALVFADGLTAPGGVLRVWDTPWHEERTLPALRALLERGVVELEDGEPDAAERSLREAVRAWQAGEARERLEDADHG